MTKQGALQIVQADGTRIIFIQEKPPAFELQSPGQAYQIRSPVANSSA